MSDYPPEAWRQLSRLLKSRRVRINPRYRNRTTFCSETGLHYKLVQDVEGAPDTRTNFTDETFALLEDAYQLPEGSIRRTLAGEPVELPARSQADSEPLADEPQPQPQPQEDGGSEPDSPITPYLKDLLASVDRRLAELNETVASRLDEQARQIEELRRERQPDGEDQRRKGA